jgi:AcrR family transcriptional regulator
MKGKKKSKRKEEILEAVLTLLGEMPLSDLSTRKIARQLGVTQPSLFRHFSSKEALLVALVGRAREQMGKGLEELLKRGGSPRERLQGFLELVLRRAGERPGLPRLLFHDSGEEREGALGRALASLVSMQENMVAVLLKDFFSGDSQEIRALARRLVALVQGTVLQGILRGVAFDPEEEARGILDLFLHGVGAEGTQAHQGGAGEGEYLGLLDVRPLLAKGEDPLAQILEALQGLQKEGVLVLRVPFRPRPLLALLNDKGFSLQVEERKKGLFEILILSESSPPIQDLRGFPAPEPMEQVLSHCAGLSPGQTLFFHTPRVPRPLLQRLQEMGFETHIQSLLDSTALLMIRS